MNNNEWLFWEATTDDYWFHFLNYSNNGDLVFYGETSKRYGNKGQVFSDGLVLSKELWLQETEDVIIKVLSSVMKAFVSDFVELEVANGNLKL